VRVTPLPVWHGRLRVFGYRLGRFAYITDVSRIPPGTYPKLRNLDVLVLDALRHEPHSTHFHLARALEEAKRIGAKRTFFTHICHRLRAKGTQTALPKNVFLAHDGLVLNLPEDARGPVAGTGSKLKPRTPGFEQIRKHGCAIISDARSHRKPLKESLP
jgi:phosphoribosyl 1,2-cyclic phosphate phosphodiesterase